MTAYELRISDWSSDVCSSDLRILGPQGWIELGKSLLKVALLAGIGAYMLLAAGHRSLGMAGTDVNGAVATLGSTLMGLMFAMAAGLTLIAATAVPIQIVRDRKSTRLNSSHYSAPRMPSFA